jgi:hypothetical protein
VARIARVLGGSLSAVFPAGGPTGDLVTSLLNDAEVPLGQVAIAESTRESFTVNESSTGQQYRFVLPGPQMTFTEQARCLDQLRMAAESAEFVVASGSLPPGVSPDYHQRVADIWTPAFFWTPLAAACGTCPAGCICLKRACESCGNASDAHWPPSRNNWPPDTHSLKAVAHK